MWVRIAATSSAASTHGVVTVPLPLPSAEDADDNEEEKAEWSSAADDAIEACRVTLGVGVGAGSGANSARHRA